MTKKPIAIFVALLITLTTLLTTPTASAKSCNNEIYFANEKIELRFDSKTGRWLSAYDLSTNKPILENGYHQPSIQFITDGKENEKKLTKNNFYAGRDRLWRLIETKTFGQNLKLLDVQKQISANTSKLTLETTEGNWRIQHEYSLKKNSTTIERRVRLTYNGDNETLLRWVELRTPMPQPLNECILEAPGYPNILHQPLNKLPMGNWPILRDRQDRDMPAWRAGLMLIRNKNSNLLIWGYNEKIPSLMLASRNELGVWFNQKFFASCRVKKNQTIEVGTQYIRLHKGNYKNAVKEFRQFWDNMGVHQQGPTPKWAVNARIYEVFLGPFLSPAKAVKLKGKPDATTWQPYPNIDTLTKDLPRIADLGFNIIQIMPRRPYPTYSVHDYMDIETHYAPEAALKKNDRTRPRTKPKSHLRRHHARRRRQNRLPPRHTLTLRNPPLASRTPRMVQLHPGWPRRKNFHMVFRPRQPFLQRLHHRRFLPLR